MKTNKNLEQMGDSVEIKHRIVKEGMGKPTGELGSLVLAAVAMKWGAFRGASSNIFYVWRYRRYRTSYTKLPKMAI